MGGKGRGLREEKKERKKEGTFISIPLEKG